MSGSSTRKITETIRIAENTIKALKESNKENESDYNRGLVNGLSLALTMLTGLQYKPLKVELIVESND